MASSRRGLASCILPSWDWRAGRCGFGGACCLVVIEAVKRPWQFNRGRGLPSTAPKRCICSRRLADCLHRENSMAASQKFGRGTGVFKGGVGGPHGPLLGKWQSRVNCQSLFPHGASPILALQHMDGHLERGLTKDSSTCSGNLVLSAAVCPSPAFSSCPRPPRPPPTPCPEECPWQSSTHQKEEECLMKRQWGINA